MKDLLRALIKEGIPATVWAGSVVKVGMGMVVAFWRGLYYVNDSTRRAGPLLYKSDDFHKVLKWLRQRLEGDRVEYDCVEHDRVECDEAKKVGGPAEAEPALLGGRPEARGAPA